jgi:hypothetical protein
MSLRTAVVFGETAVRPLSAKNFLLGSREGISIEYDADCLLVLFYDDSDASRALLDVWMAAAKLTVGPIFAAVNLVSEEKLANEFIQIRMNPDHPFNWASVANTPFALTYRKGWPQAYYNGAIDAGAIHEYAVTLACQAGYREGYTGGFGSVTTPSTSTPPAAPAPPAPPSTPGLARSSRARQ